MASMAEATHLDDNKSRDETIRFHKNMGRRRMNPQANTAKEAASKPSAECLIHSSTCSSIFLRSIYDKTCPRCAIVGKVILLRRKTVANGASLYESQAASLVAQKLIKKHNLKPAELLDRLYVSVTNKIRVAAKPRFHREQENNIMEGMEL